MAHLRAVAHLKFDRPIVRHLLPSYQPPTPTPTLPHPTHTHTYTNHVPRTSGLSPISNVTGQAQVIVKLVDTVRPADNKSRQMKCGGVC